MQLLQKPNTNAMNRVPTEIKLYKTTGIVQLYWDDGEASAIGAKELHQQCPCSGCRASRQSKMPLLVDGNIGIENVVMIGSTGLQIVFTDGHDRGIYPWNYLYTLAEGITGSYLTIES